MELLVALAAGLFAGFINTLAGSGSFLTLPALIFMGLSSQVANGTNRIGILLAGIVAVWTYHKQGKLPLGGLTPILPAILLGSVAGALVAVKMPAESMDQVIGGLMLLMLASLLLRPKQWLPRGVPEPKGGPLAKNLAFFAIGVYGGFIQAGVGLFLLSGLVLLLGFDLVRANAVKVLLVLLFTVPSLAVFLLNDQVVWSLGLLVAAGQCVGAFIAARTSSRWEGADRWIRLLLIGVLGATVLKLFEIPPF
ncbi:MAG: sulfite exporter TauE/SafE family protein [Planctomycetota bacterium]